MKSATLARVSPRASREKADWLGVWNAYDNIVEDVGEGADSYRLLRMSHGHGLPASASTTRVSLDGDEIN